MNVFLLGYFWGVVHKKRGPTGIRGPIGEKGSIGIKGKCELDLVEAYLIKELMQHIDTLYFAKTNYHLINTDNYTTPCKYLNNKIAVMSGSRQYKTIYKNLYITYNPKLYDTENFNTETQQTDTKPISSIIYYLKNIWTEWFNLIYSATSTPGDWFNDEYADEDYSWVGTNPFIEIRKYDVYYWGITRNFRPLKAEICRTSGDYQNSKFPLINQILEPRLKIIKTNDYYPVRRAGTGTSSSDDNPDAAIWSPKQVTINNDTYYPVGDILTHQGLTQTKKNKTIVGKSQFTYTDDKRNLDDEHGDNGDNGPDMQTILVAGDVVSPIDYKVLETTASSSSDDRMYLSELICPRGYTGLGTVVKSSDNDYNSGFKCIPDDCVEVVSPPKFSPDLIKPIEGGIKSIQDIAKALEGKKFPYKIWEKRHKYYHWQSARWRRAWDYDINVLNDWTKETDATPENAYNMFKNPAHPYNFYKIKDTCLAPPNFKKASMKTVESKYDDLGIGWHGHPYKLDPKYSIFSFLGLAPEGMIVHSGTGRRYYAIHYGGEEPSIYIVLNEDDSGKYTQAIRTNSDVNNTTTEIRKISKQDTRQQWKFVLEPDKKYFKLLNINNSRNLNIDLDPTLGKAIYSTITNGDSDNYLFSFIPSFGTHLDNM
jgi:hypothetical protein